MPSRNRTIRPSASCLRYIRKISRLWRFSNLRKLSTIHPTCGLCSENRVLTNLITGPTRQYWQQPFRRSDLALLSGLLTIRKLASQESTSWDELYNLSGLFEC